MRRDQVADPQEPPVEQPDAPGAHDGASALAVPGSFESGARGPVLVQAEAARRQHPELVEGQVQEFQSGVGGLENRGLMPYDDPRVSPNHGDPSLPCPNG
jgi:hypothetical protein